MPLFSGRHSSKIGFLPPARGGIFLNQVDQPAPMERMAKDGCRLAAFLEVISLRAVRMGEILDARVSFGHGQAAVGQAGLAEPPGIPRPPGDLR